MTAYLTVFYLFFWTHGVLLMTGRNSARETVKNLLSPAVIGVLVGLACFLLRIRLPQLFTDALDSVGSMNTPLAMLVAGATLGQAGLQSLLQRPRAYYVSFLKLVVVPALMILILAFFRIPEAVKVTLIVASGCPVGACCTCLLYTSIFRSARYCRKNTRRRGWSVFLLLYCRTAGICRMRK